MVDQVRLRYQNQSKTPATWQTSENQGIARLLKTKEINQQNTGERATTKISSALAMLCTCPGSAGGLRCLAVLPRDSDVLSLFRPTGRPDGMDPPVHIFRSGRNPLRRLYHTALHGYIQTSWKYGKSNGLSEGLNSKVKILKRVSFGLHTLILSADTSCLPAES